MRKFLLAFFCSSCFALSALAQQPPKKSPPSDADLLALVKKHLQSPVTKTTTSNGDVFLQRDMSAYLRSTVQAAQMSARETDKGHDHKDAMLREFLNRPHPTMATMNKYFDEAASEFGVPAVLLKAAGQVQSNWAQVSESIYGSWGVMGLIENSYAQQISQAAILLNTTADAIRNDSKTNIRAAAVLLARYQQAKPATTVEDWFEAVKALTGLRGKNLRHELALRIFDVAKNGSKSISLWGEIIRLEPAEVSLPKAILEPDALPSSAQRTTAVDYPTAVSNFTTCNFGSRPAGSIIKYYFVHYVATGTYQGAVDWFKNCTSQVSAHYVVRNFDGEVSQVVAETDRAWSQGVTVYNDLGIGVEHEVLATNLAMWDSEPMLYSATNLCRNVCDRRAIPKQRIVGNPADLDAGVYGHNDVKATDCPNLTPARWTAFLTRVNNVALAAPTLYSVANAGTGTQITVAWKANTDAALAGYRLYYATNETLTDWALAANESTLTPSTTSVTLNALQFVVPPTGKAYHFKLTTVASDGVNPMIESVGSDVYSASSATAGPKVLIVDGFDRFGSTGSWAGSTHSFASSYFKGLRNNASLQVTTVANERIEDGTFALTNYDIVVWFVGDESSVNVALSASEKAAIQAYLSAGGKLLISGSEIAYNLGRSGSATLDLSFFNNFLKATYSADGSVSYSAATGVASTPFSGLTVPFGAIYPEDSPDAIGVSGGSTGVLKYNGVSTFGGIVYKGPFVTGGSTGALIYLSFALETATDATITAFMEKALAYFDVPKLALPVAYDDALMTQTLAVKRLNVLGNDLANGVPFNPATVSIVTQATAGTVTVDAAGNVTYVSNPGFTGTDRYQYIVQNTAGVSSNLATVTITVGAAVSINCNPAAPEVDDQTPKRELRGVWISSVSNLDWPSRTQTPAQQQAALRTILDQLVQAGINTVYLQVRPEADALYPSALEPWSYWLTNAQGTAPSPLWDPLSFATDEAHKRGLELHAWFNPFRAKQSTPTLAASHVVNQHPEWILDVPTTPTASKILDPGLPAVRQYISDVVVDVASRYDVDGIHFDDYFYPSVITTQDDASYAANPITGVTTKADWRRANGNLFVAKVYDAIAALNASTGRNVVFGVSPFGIWKSGTPAGTSGSSSFTDQFYDPIAWLQAGKVDYLAPQLYWRVTGAQDYNGLSKWWNDQGVTYNRYIYPGLALYKLVDANEWAASEIEGQIALNRDASRDQVRGQILFRSGNLTTNAKGILTALQTNQFKYKALQPAMPWKDAVCPNAPVNIRRDGDSLRWDAPTPATDGDGPRKYAIYRFNSTTEATTNANDGSRIVAVNWANRTAIYVGTATGYYVVTSLDKAGNESQSSAAIILPVTGLNLSVKLSGNTALVNWTTLTEINTSRFEVERSTDGRNFSYLKAVPAAGNSSSARVYSVQDLLTTAGSYYYRIRSVDRDGKASYSNVKSIGYRTGTDVLVGPNPFATSIYLNNLVEVKRIDLLDASGKKVLSKMPTGQSSLQLETGHLATGFYTLRLTMANGEQRFVKLTKL